MGVAELEMANSSIQMSYWFQAAHFICTRDSNSGGCHTKTSVHYKQASLNYSRTHFCYPQSIAKRVIR